MVTTKDIAILRGALYHGGKAVGLALLLTLGRRLDNFTRF